MSSLESRRNTAGETRWRVRFRHEGKNVAKTFATEEHARKWKALLDAAGPAHALAALDSPAPTRPRTVSQQVAHHIDHLTAVTGGTKARYRRAAELSIDEDPIGRIPLHMLDRDAVALWVNRLTATGMAGKTIKNRHSLLSAAMASAVRDGLLPANPARGVRIPRTEHMRREMVTLAHEEFAQLLDHIPEGYRPLVILLVATGVRFGEATALTVGDVDLKGKRPSARIRQAWKYTGGNGHEIGPPKSRRSTRTVRIPPDAVPVLEPLVRGRPASAYLITTPTRGVPVRSNHFWEDVWAPAVHAFAGDTKRPEGTWEPGPGKHPRVHDLRHTFASWAIQGGVPLPVIQRQMGHESIQTTVDTYGHLTPADFDPLGAAVAPAFRPTPPQIEA